MIWHKRSSSAYIKYLRKKGIHIGEHCIIRAPRTARIDVSRPSLVTIGNNVDMNMNFQILRMTGLRLSSELNIMTL